jgi:antitoxin component YwqK of YwqJK toxin-antitoxin module
MEGAWAGYDSTGQLLYEGHYKNGKKEGDWDEDNKDGTVDKERTGTFKDGEKISD